MLMAQSAGMDRVAMTTGIHTLDRLQQHNPIACLDDIQKLIELLK
jgi:phosphoglycolate phosphatase-like HAD superfamily hydrolase